MARKVVQWTELHSVTLSARYIPSRKSVLMDQLSCPNQVLLTEQSLLPRVFEASLGGIRSSPSRPVRYESKYETATVLVSSFGPDGVEVGLFPAFLG